MKKNLVFLSALILGVLMISMVCAGWFGATGNVIEKFQDSADMELRPGLLNKIQLDGEEISVLAIIVGEDSATVNINGQVKEIREGSSVVVGNYNVKLVSSDAGFWKRDRSRVMISERVGPSVDDEEACIGGICTLSMGGNYPISVDLLLSDQSFTIELISASDISATLRVDYNNELATSTKEITEGTSKTFFPEFAYSLTINLINADETTSVQMASFTYDLSSTGGGGGGGTTNEDEVTYQGILNMFNGAELIEYMIQPLAVGNCNSKCSNIGKTCVHAEHQYAYGTGDWIFHPQACNGNVESSATETRTLHCWCASAP